MTKPNNNKEPQSKPLVFVPPGAKTNINNLFMEPPATIYNQATDLSVPKPKN